MSFDLYLQHFVAGESVPIDPSPVAAVLASERHSPVDEFGFYRVEFASGHDVEFSAAGLEGREPFDGCAFHIRGISLGLFEFVFRVASAGDFVIWNPQGDDSIESPVLILVRPCQQADLPSEVADQYQNHPVCTSGAMLGHLLFPGYENWDAYRKQIP